MRKCLAILLVLVFVALHVGTTVLDTFVSIPVIAVFVPFASSYKTFWLGLGTIALDLLLALLVTSLLRGRLGYRSWRRVHWIAYACWPIGLAHGLGTGTDRTTTGRYRLKAAHYLEHDPLRSRTQGADGRLCPQALRQLHDTHVQAAPPARRP